MDQLSSAPPNLFANDGSFFDQFRKKIGSQSKNSEDKSDGNYPTNPNCQKQRPGFRPKIACKPINIKASLKKQLKSDLAVKSTLDSKSVVPESVALSCASQHKPSSSTSRFSKDWKPPILTSDVQHETPTHNQKHSEQNRSTEKKRSPGNDTKKRSSEKSPDQAKKISEEKSPIRSRSESRSSSRGEGRHSSSEKSASPSESSNGTTNISPTSTDQNRKRKRKSRWGEGPAEPPAEAPAATPILSLIPLPISTPPLANIPLPDPPGTTPVIAMINGVPVVVPTVADTPQEVTLKALSTLTKLADNKNKYDYDSDEETENGTWEHKQRAHEIESTSTQVDLVNTINEGKHHLGDFLPTEELQKFMTRVTAIKSGKSPEPLAPDNSNAIQSDNIGFQMLQKAGWKEGTGLGASSSGIVQPIDRGMVKPGTAGLGASKPDEPLPGDDEFDVYRKRMMLAYKYRPNPMKNPRRAYY